MSHPPAIPPIWTAFPLLVFDVISSLFTSQLSILVFPIPNIPPAKTFKFELIVIIPSVALMFFIVPFVVPATILASGITPCAAPSVVFMFILILLISIFPLFSFVTISPLPDNPAACPFDSISISFTFIFSNFASVRAIDITPLVIGTAPLFAELFFILILLIFELKIFTFSEPTATTPAICIVFMSVPSIFTFFTVVLFTVNLLAAPTTPPINDGIYPVVALCVISKLLISESSIVASLFWHPQTPPIPPGESIFMLFILKPFILAFPPFTPIAPPVWFPSVVDDFIIILLNSVFSIFISLLQNPISPPKFWFPDISFVPFSDVTIQFLIVAGNDTIVDTKPPIFPGSAYEFSTFSLFIEVFITLQFSNFSSVAFP